MSVIRRLKIHWLRWKIRRAYRRNPHAWPTILRTWRVDVAPDDQENGGRER